MLKEKFYKKSCFRSRITVRLGISAGVALSLIFSLILFPSVRGLAAAGDLDATFGIGGKVVTDIFAAHNVANDLAIQPDGKIVVVGQSSRLRGRAPVLWTICRYNGDGLLDTSFDHDGIVTTLFPRGNGGNPFGVAIQPDGKIVVAGVSEFADGSMVVTRYETDGGLDKSFDGDGIAVVTFGGLRADAKDVEIQTDGKIVLAGSGGADLGGGVGEPDFAVARLNPNGSPDLLFGSAGKVITDFGSISLAADLVIQPDGKLVVAGVVIVPPAGPPVNVTNIGLARYDANGSLDSSFNGNGKVITDVMSVDNFARAVAVQPDGKIVVAGYFRISLIEPEELLVRYNAGGALDTSFDDDGIVLTPGGEANDVAIQADGKIVVARLSPFGFSTSRHNLDGSPDNSFGGDGVVITQFTTTFEGSDLACCTAIQTDGKIIVAGKTDPAVLGSNSDFALARYLED